MVGRRTTRGRRPPPGWTAVSARSAARRPSPAATSDTIVCTSAATCSIRGVNPTARQKPIIVSWTTGPTRPAVEHERLLGELRQPQPLPTSQPVPRRQRHQHRVRRHHPRRQPRRQPHNHRLVPGCAPTAGAFGRSSPTSIRPSSNASVCRSVVIDSRSSTTSGYAVRNAPSSRGSTSNVADCTNRSRNVPSSPRCVRCAARTASSDRRSRSCASARKRRPGRGQHEPLPHPGEQLDPEIAFERRDLPAQRRLGQVQPHGRPPDVQLLGDHHERPQLP